MGVFEDNAKGKSDWTDRDLLVYDEAEERLAAQQTELEAAVSAAAPAEADELRQRLKQVTTLLASFRARRAAGTSGEAP
jgi:hypothetical protein